MALKALVIYDSQFGNTERIAWAIRDALSAKAETRLVRASNVAPRDLSAVDVLIVGSPTQRFHATEPIDRLLKGVSLRGVNAAAFDTRFDMDEVDSRALRLAVKVAGDSAAYAAPRISAALEKVGATIVAPPEGFIVNGTEGPLKDGEIQRAGEWAKGILAVL
ncbi:MAG: flavodoxin family protein [Candidatus Promineofilum sp.]|jgi:flavodoxin|nr:flavodoxin family protein [Promineifilum sp.]